MLYLAKQIGLPAAKDPHAPLLRHRPVPAPGMSASWASRLVPEPGPPSFLPAGHTATAIPQPSPLMRAPAGQCNDSQSAIEAAELHRGHSEPPARQLAAPSGTQLIHAARAPRRVQRYPHKHLTCTYISRFEQTCGKHGSSKNPS